MRIGRGSMKWNEEEQAFEVEDRIGEGTMKSYDQMSHRIKRYICLQRQRNGNLGKCEEKRI